MIIHLYTFCRDEELLIPFFLSHYSYVDKINIFFDVNSIDNSERLILADKRCKLIEFDFDGKYRDDFLMYAKNSEWKTSIGVADWIIVVDMDEFLYHNSSIIGFLKRCKEESITIPSIKGYDMFSAMLPVNDGTPITEQLKYGVRNKRFDKKVIFDPKKVSNIYYRPGAHNCDPEGYIKYSDTYSLKLLHYKFLGPLDRFSKRWNTFGNNLSAVNLKNNWSTKRLDPRQAVYRYEYAKENAVKVI